MKDEEKIRLIREKMRGRGKGKERKGERRKLEKECTLAEEIRLEEEERKVEK